MEYAVIVKARLSEQPIPMWIKGGFPSIEEAVAYGRLQLSHNSSLGSFGVYEDDERFTEVANTRWT